MSKRIRNRMQQRARSKRTPFPPRMIGYMPLGPVDPGFVTKLDDEHYDRRRRSLRDHESEHAA
jgi:hypothetical protein